MLKLVLWKMTLNRLVEPKNLKIISKNQRTYTQRYKGKSTEIQKVINKNKNTIYQPPGETPLLSLTLTDLSDFGPIWALMGPLWVLMGPYGIGQKPTYRTETDL